MVDDTSSLPSSEMARAQSPDQKDLTDTLGTASSPERSTTPILGDTPSTPQQELSRSNQQEIEGKEILAKEARKAEARDWLIDRLMESRFKYICTQKYPDLTYNPAEDFLQKRKEILSISPSNRTPDQKKELSRIRAKASHYWNDPDMIAIRKLYSLQGNEFRRTALPLVKQLLAEISTGIAQNNSDNSELQETRRGIMSAVELLEIF